MLNNIENLVAILDEACRVNLITEEECNALKIKLQKKTGIA